MGFDVNNDLVEDIKKSNDLHLLAHLLCQIDGQTQKNIFLEFLLDFFLLKK
jgi:hypothetical protein